MKSPINPALTFLADGRDVRTFMRRLDWTRSPLGAPEFWPQSLRVIVDLLLSSKFPMFVAWGPELGFLYNDAYAEIIGTKHPVALGGRFRTIWAEIWDDIAPSIDEALSGKAVYHRDFPLVLNRKGYDEETWFTFSYSPVRDETGEVTGIFCAATETTEQVLAERHRIAELNGLQRLFQHAPGIIAVLRGPQHIFDIANDAYRSHVGRGDVLGKPVRQALPELEGQGLFEILDDAYSSGKPFFGKGYPLMLQREPGGPLEQRFVDVIFQPTFDHLGNVIGIFVEGIDVTDTIKTYQALQKSENELRLANRRKDDFLAMLAHELRNPLAPIANAAEVLKLSAPSQGPVQKMSQVLSRQVRHMTELLDDLLDVSLVTRGLITLEYEVLSVNSLLVDAVEQVTPFIDTKQQNFSVSVPDEQLFVVGDRTRLIQVFSNILNNAAKYTPDLGRIDLSIVADAEAVIVTVKDDGVGIAATLLPYIFNLFAQAERSLDRAQGGLGLGLSLVKSLVGLHGGKVFAYSDGAGMGSSFTVVLPRCDGSTVVPTQIQTADLHTLTRK